jgi:hypothetical protein
MTRKKKGKGKKAQDDAEDSPATTPSSSAASVVAPAGEKTSSPSSSVASSRDKDKDPSGSALIICRNKYNFFLCAGGDAQLTVVFESTLKQKLTSPQTLAIHLLLPRPLASTPS